ncbi:MAG: recombination mediator RecR [Solobacterium sp.]|nr:recombination mediator RecR [Solobacterium sp.]MDY2732404.1 recombination mediator RecR [Erysipelotrichaceae bacterium]MCI7732995.1 recombination mediator RecR [Solobacterium sp.]MDD5842193.1 recombination mediator RecR [Solobacterium sp.]MDD5982719.1 recombination mediator RecR [Solobacterium sp.]
MYPEAFNKTIEELEKLPGVGHKTALRYAFRLLKMSKEELDEFSRAIEGLSSIRQCSVCGFLSDEEECLFCKDETRDHSKIMIVETSQDAVAIEKTGSYRGLYHVLGSLISSSKGVFPEDIKFDKLLNRADSVQEIIIALSSTMDGEMTSLYISKLLETKGVKVTRLASGLPMGSSLDYADDLTLIQALTNRKEIK